jgi:hypothetical protein
LIQKINAVVLIPNVNEADCQSLLNKKFMLHEESFASLAIQK